jgi:NTP pyrophosphatase (non-canonical NTP hydrolase)
MKAQDFKTQEDWDLYRQLSSQTLREWAQTIHQYAVDKGWWDKPESRNFGDLTALLHTEVSEAYEEYRNGRTPTERYYAPQERDVTDDSGNVRSKPEGIPSELADIMIRIFDMCGYYQIDIRDVLVEKHLYNLARPYRHGGKVS